MRYIAHRGNIHGIKKNKENEPEYIMAAIDAGFECEIDVWYINGGWRLGHDGPQYSVSFDFLCHKDLWLHCKNIDAFVRLSQITSMNAFWHQEDDYTLTSKGWVWCYPGKMVPTDYKTVAVKPEIHDTDWKRFSAICSDYVGFHRDQTGTI
jgi:hypothetical protein